MLQIPLSFKGPKGIINHFFSEKIVFEALQLIMDNRLHEWHHNKTSEMTSASVSEKNETFQTAVFWPLNINNEASIGTCSCKNHKPCVHICALTLESKSRLDQIPPFTGQLQANRNIGQTLSDWINRQHYDPYPNMARHRLVYFLDCDENEETFTISLHKAYLTQEDKYINKSKLNLSVLNKKPLPKFVSLADQVILKQLNSLYEPQTHKFIITDSTETQLIRNILQTERCFWKNCYRPPLNLEDTNLNTQEMVRINDSVRIAIYKNTIYFNNRIQKQHSKPLKINPLEKIIPRLVISTHQMKHRLLDDYMIEADVAKISFKQGEKEFSFSDLSHGQVVASPELMKQLAGHLRQIEKLDSVYAHFESILLYDFHINDRFIPEDIRNSSLLITALISEGWNIEFDMSFRLNRTEASDWYASVKTTQKKQDWFELELGVTIDGQPVNILPFIVHAIKSGAFESQNDSSSGFHIKLEDGRNIDINHNSVKQILSALTELRDEKSLSSTNQLQLSGHQIIRLNHLQKTLEHLTDSTIEWNGEKEIFKKAKKLAKNAKLAPVYPPEKLSTKLRDYQLTGLSWLQFLRENELGGILADDMGLGKTLQVLAHLLLEKQKKRLKQPCLIVVPTSLLSNWKNEIKTFVPDLSCIILNGPQREKTYQNLQNYDLIITSYGIMSRDSARLQDYHFYYLILDEAQTIKNSRTLNARTASSLTAKYKLCLTGTPIENHLGELWSLFNFLMPGFLGTRKQFENIYRIPIEKHQNTERQTELSKRVSVFMLRRTKAEVAKELPDKSEMVQLIELQEQQSNLYETIRLSMSDEIRKAMTASDNKNSLIISNALLRLRQVSCHPDLLKINNITNESAKLQWLETVLPNMLEEGRRILIFSSFTQMLDIIQDLLDKLHISSHLLTGKTPAEKRGDLIESFQTGQKDVFLISLKAGGAGINLTRADTVIHFDPWWNPAAESQASDRAHRIGQTRNVFVYKLIAKGTVEEKIYNLQKQKSSLAESVFDNQGHISSIFSNTNWQELFKPIG